MTKNILIGMAVVILIVLGIVYFSSNQEAPQTNTETMSDTSSGEVMNEAETPKDTTGEGMDVGAGMTQTMEDNTVSGYTLAEVATHNSQSSCWAVVSGQVYDLTNWISKHPGGPQKILNICGTDATATFEGQHGGQEKPEATLATFLLGPLAQ